MIKDEFIEKLKEKTNIVDVVGSYCTLKKKGSSYWACCPLPGHSERTPSFSVNEPGQFYKCFGCGKGGNVYTFVMEMENLDFIGAVRFLAEKAGMEVEETERKDGKYIPKTADRDRLLALMKATGYFYIDNLKKPEARRFNDYLLSRGFDRKTVRDFGIGASLDFYSLPKHLKNLGYTEEEMLKCGVCTKYEREKGGVKKSEIGDSLYGRLIIPIINNFSCAIAFGGRLLEKKPNFAKYKNTQETELFIKNRTLYNINNLKKLRAEGQIKDVIMVEGYMDAISLYSAGFKNVVASMGTSLTVEQARILKRYTDTVIISYDGDGAGQKATIRGLEILKKEGLTVKVLILPDGLDPDDVIKKYGQKKYAELLAKSVPLVDFKLLNLKKSYDLKDISQKRKYISEAIKVIAESDSESEREDLLRKLGKETGTTFEALKRDTDRLISGEKTETEVSLPVEKQTSGRVESAERLIICAGILKKPYAKDYDLSSFDFSSEKRRKIVDVITRLKEEGKEAFPATIASYLTEEELAEYNAVLSSGDNVFGTNAEKKYFSDCVALLKKDKLEEQLTVLKELYNSETDTEKRKQIAKKIAELTVKIRK